MVGLALTSILWLFVPTDGFDSNIVVQQLHPADRLRLELEEGTVTRAKNYVYASWDSTRHFSDVINGTRLAANIRAKAL